MPELVNGFKIRFVRMDILFLKGGICMSEENKNRNKDKGRQKNVLKYNTEPKKDRADDTEFAEDSEFLNINGKETKEEK